MVSLVYPRGFRNAQVPLAFGMGHTWQHLEEARVRYGQAGTRVRPELTHAMLGGTIRRIPLYLILPTTALFLDAGLAEEVDFSFALKHHGSRWWDLVLPRF